jgi:hypothetical protein
VSVRSILRGALAVVAVIVTLVAGAVHAASIAGIDVEQWYPEVWSLHWGAIVMILPALLLSVPRWSSRYTLRELFVLVPIWARVLIVASFLNAVACFLLVIPRTGGVPVQGDGRFAFRNHGVVRVVSESEFHAQRALTMQGFSSFWLYFYLTSALYLLTARRAP